MVVLALTLAACAPPAAPAASTAAPASATAAPKPAASAAAVPSASPAAAAPAPVGATRIVASYSNQVADDLPLWMARESGIFARHGLDVEDQLMNSTTGMAALLSGQTQFALIGGSEVVNADAGGADVVMIATLSPYYIFSLEVPDAVKSFDDLKGKTLGVAGAGGSIDIALRKTLTAHGLDPARDVSIVSTGSTVNAVAALLSGGISGTMLHPPDSNSVETKGFHPLVDMAAEKTPAALLGVSVRRTYIAQHRDQVQAFVDSIVEAIAREQQDEAFTEGVLAKYLKSDDRTAMQQTWDYYAHRVHQVRPYPTTEQLVDARDQLAKSNPNASSFDLSQAIDASFVKSAADRGVGGPG